MNARTYLISHKENLVIPDNNVADDNFKYFEFFDIIIQHPIVVYRCRVQFFVCTISKLHIMHVDTHKTIEEPHAMCTFMHRTLCFELVTNMEEKALTPLLLVQAPSH